MFRTIFVDKFKTHLLYSITLFRKTCCLCYNVEKYCRAEQATYDKMVHAHCMLDIEGY